MARTIRSMTFPGRGVPEVFDVVQAWAADGRHKLEVVSDVRPQAIGMLVTLRVSRKAEAAEWLVSAYWNNPALIQIIITQEQPGAIVRAEGWVPSLGTEMDFSPDAVSGVLPRKQGWQAIEGLWQRLSILSDLHGQIHGSEQTPPPSAYPQSSGTIPTAPPQSGTAPSHMPPLSQAAQTSRTAGAGPIPRFCGYCGKPISFEDSFCTECGRPIQRH